MAKKEEIHAFIGNDEALVKESALAKATELAPPDDEFGLEIVSGAADHSEHAVRIVSSAIEAIQTLPFFGGGKVVWLQGANFMGDSVTGKSESTLGALESLIEVLEAGLPPDVKFVLSASEIDKRRSFYKRLGKVAKIEIHDKVDTTKSGWETAVMSNVAQRAEGLGLRFAPGALERFTLMVGADTRSIESELEKLSLYVADRSANEADVSLLTSTSHLGIIFEIGDAVMQRNLPRALRLIELQIAKGESAVGLLLAAIVPKVRQMLQAQDLVERHGLSVSRGYKAFQQRLESLPASEISRLPRKKDGGLNIYPLFLAAQVSHRFTSEELCAALESCLEANLRLVTTQLDPLVVMNQLVTRILART